MIKLPQMDPDLVSNEIQNFIFNKVKSMNKKGVVIGLSGGIDSSVTAVLCKKALHNTSYNLYGFILPGGTSPAQIQDTKDAQDLAFNYNIPVYHCSLPFLDAQVYATQGVLDISKSSITHLIFDKKIIGNMASRIRANMLSTYAEFFNCIVCGTGNKDEDYGIGYYTLFGDGAVHMSPIGGLSKRLVYQMANHLGINKVVPNVVSKQPSARLELNQTDFRDLGYGYDCVELVMEGLSQKVSKENIIKILFRDYDFDTRKFNNGEELYNDIISRHNIALKKAMLVSPDIAKITLEY